MSATSKTSSVKKGIACILASAFFFAMMNVFVRLSGDLPSVEKSVFRNLVAFFIAGVIMLKEHQSFKYERKVLPDLLKRSLLGTIGILGNFYAVDHLLLADASAIQKLVPFVTLVFSHFLLKERIRGYQIFCVLAAFASSLLVIKPSFNLLENAASLVAAIGALGAGMAYVYVRKLSLAGVAQSRIIFFFSGCSVLLLLPLLLFDCKMPDGMQVLYLLMAGCMAAGGQYSVTYAYSFAPASSISIFDYIQILFSAVLGYFFFLQVPDGWSVLGYLLIVSFALLNYGLSRKISKAKRA